MYAELKVGNLEEQGYMLFKMPEQNIHMPILAFK